MGQLLDWFLDDEDAFYSPWRGVILWVLALVAFTGIALLIATYAPGGGSTSGSDQDCPASYQASGWC